MGPAACGIDLDEGLAASVVGAECMVSVPLRGEVGPVAGEARVLARPIVLAEGVNGEHGLGVRGRWQLDCAGTIPQIGVVCGWATQP